MATNNFEKGTMESLRKIMWDTPGVRIESSEEGLYDVYTLFSGMQEIFQIKKNRKNEKDIVLSVNGKDMRWSHENLDFLYTDVFAAYINQKSITKTLKKEAQEKSKNQDEESAVNDFLEQFLPQQVLTI